jgi:hypothetical protein
MATVRVLSDIPFELPLADIVAQLRVKPRTADAEALAELVRRIQGVGRPRALYAEAFVEEGDEEGVRVGDVRFQSRALRRSLDGVERVFPFVATCGREVAEANPAPPDDIVTAFWWDALQVRLLEAAVCRVAEDIEERFRLGPTVMMSPGAADASVWPIEDQRPLFRLLGDVEAAIGVRLTESLFMSPTKSVSGIRFATERDFRSCQVCRRPACPRREAPFDPALWEELQG